MSTPKHFAEKLLQIKALQLNLQKPYTWASGWRSPVYCDNRKVLSFPYVRDFVKSELANMILEQFPDADVVAGVATAGIPHGVMAADLLKLPFIYVRAKPKEHGMGNQIEGVLKPGQKVVVIEDLISTGKSSLQVVDVLREQGAEVLGMCGLFTYGFPIADEAFQKAGLPLYTISNYAALMEVAEEQGNIGHVAQRPGKLATTSRRITFNHSSFQNKHACRYQYHLVGRRATLWLLTGCYPRFTFTPELFASFSSSSFSLFSSFISLSSSFLSISNMRGSSTTL
jgi:orotate phosphoribosyltransferase